VRKSRSKHQKKADRLITPDTGLDEIRSDLAVAPFDRCVEAMDRKWGIDRICELVVTSHDDERGQAILDSYAKVMHKLNEAIDKDDVEQVKKWTATAIRGLKAMDEHITQAGVPPVDLAVMPIEDDNGNSYAIMHDPRAWKEIQDRHPALELLTQREVAIAVTFWKEHRVGQMVDEAKAAFPGAEVVSFKTKSAKEDTLEDELPF